MSSVIVASDSIETGREVAERVAAKLGGRMIGRELLAVAAERHGVDVASLSRALDDPPTLLGMSRATRARLLAFVREVTVEALAADGVVCWGLASHLYVHGVSHVLTVRIVADPAGLADQLARARGVSPDKARRLLARRSDIRRRWAVAAFDRDEDDPSLYDLVIKLNQIDLERAVAIVADTVADRAFVPMSYSRKVLADMVVEAKARSLLLKEFPDLKVRLVHGTLEIDATSTRRGEQAHAEAVRELAATIPGVDDVTVRVVVDDIREAAASLR
jgi:cytidylate kinase